MDVQEPQWLPWSKQRAGPEGLGSGLGTRHGTGHRGRRLHRHNDAVPSLPPLPPDRPDLLERYGAGRRPWTSVAPLVALGALLVVMVGLFAASGFDQAAAEVRSGISSFGDITPTSIDVTVEVVRAPGTPVACEVTAVGEGQVDVGAIRIVVPTDPPERILVTETVPTASKPRAARLLGCFVIEPSAESG